MAPTKADAAPAGELVPARTHRRVAANAASGVERIAGTTDAVPFLEFDPAVLGVRESGLTDRLDAQRLPVYVPRRGFDARLDAALTSEPTEVSIARLVVVAGDPKAGKTRGLYEAVSRTHPQRRVLAVRRPDRDNCRPVERLIERTGRLGDPSSLLVWIDDAHEHLERGLTNDTLNQLRRQLPGAIVAMTIHRDRLNRDNSEIGRDLNQTLLTASKSTTLQRALDDDELAAARLAHPKLAERPDLRFLAAVPQLRTRLGEDNPCGRAIVDAALAWRHAGMPPAIDRAALRALTNHTIVRHSPLMITDVSFNAALHWATEPVSSTAALLLPTGEDRWQAHDGLLAGDDGALAVDDDVWTEIVACAQTSDLLAVGVAAYHRHEHDRARIAWQQAAAAGDTDSMYNLGVLLERRGELVEAEQWWRTAADAGHTGAMFNLGLLLKERGELVETEQWWRKGADAGHTGAMFNLGLLLKERGELVEAEQWWRKGADAGLTGSMSNLGLLLKERGELVEAEQWYRKGAHEGNAASMSNLGALLEERGELVEAEQWYRKGAHKGNAASMSNLGALLQQRGDLDAAEQWWRTGADADHTASMFNLGLLLQQRGELVEAEQWWRKGAERGLPEAAAALVALEAGRLTDHNPVTDRGLGG